MSDLISREALRKAFHERIHYFNKSSWDEANAIIDNAPTVELLVARGTNGVLIPITRPAGRWIKDGHHIRCNKCNEYICDTDREGNKIPDNFCPNCGAKMGGEHND